MFSFYEGYHPQNAILFLFTINILTCRQWQLLLNNLPKIIYSSETSDYIIKDDFDGDQVIIFK